MKDVVISETVKYKNTTTETVWLGGFGHWLKDTQEQAGLTSRALSRKSDISMNTIARMRAGQLPTVNTYYKLMVALGQPIESFKLVPKFNASIRRKR